MKILYLTVKVSIIHLLIKMRIIKNVWYESELLLGRLRGESLYKKLR